MYIFDIYIYVNILYDIMLVRMVFFDDVKEVFFKILVEFRKMVRGFFFIFYK